MEQMQITRPRIGDELENLRIPFEQGFGEMKYQFRVYYRTEPTFRIDKTEELSLKDFTYLMTHLADDPEQIYSHMQGERWSPMGEARELIRKSGLCHTSMSVGDLVARRTTSTKEPFTFFIVDHVGFKQVALKGFPKN